MNASAAIASLSWRIVVTDSERLWPLLQQVSGHAQEGGSGTGRKASKPSSGDDASGAAPGGCNKTWAMFIKRVYEADPLSCPRCGSEMEVVAFIDPPQELLSPTTTERRLSAEKKMTILPRLESLTPGSQAGAWEPTLTSRERLNAICCGLNPR